MQKGEDRIVKCTCGHEFGDYRDNWKLKALIHVRKSRKKSRKSIPIRELLIRNIVKSREYYCPGCGTQLQVETVPFGYPVVFDFLPDLDSFYQEWLGQPLPQEKEFKDLSYDYIKNNWTI